MILKQANIEELEKKSLTAENDVPYIAIRLIDYLLITILAKLILLPQGWAQGCVPPVYNPPPFFHPLSPPPKRGGGGVCIMLVLMPQNLL